jgi:alginate O-acetyltransferase complex protein AlgI
MFLHPSLYLLMLLFAAVVYWLIPRGLWVARSVFLSVLSVLLVTLMMPVLGIFLIGSTLVAYAYSYVRLRSDSIWLAAVFVAAQVALMLGPDLTGESQAMQAAAFVGLAFFTLRNIGYVVDVYKQKTDASYLDLLFLNAFFPTYSAGPVENVKTVNSSSCDTSFDLSEILLGATRILVGILKFYYVADVLLDPVIDKNFPTTAADIAAASPGTALVLAILGWVTLYVQFSGYADIAIGSSRMFGIRIQENFNYPFLATNIQKFWQRWNMSILNFVSEYIYLNFVRQTGLRIVGLYLVFLAIGMWHRVSLGYLFWGLAHGSAMALHVTLRRQPFYQSWQEYLQSRPLIAWPTMFITWALTISFVSIVSAVGAAPNLDTSVAYLRALFLP